MQERDFKLDGFKWLKDESLAEEGGRARGAGGARRSPSSELAVGELGEILDLLAADSGPRRPRVVREAR